MKEILKLTFSLTLICAIAGTCLALVSRKTEEPILRNARIQQTAKMQMLLPSRTLNTIEEWRSQNGDVIFYKATDIDDELLAYCAVGYSDDGFGGRVTVMAGLTTEGKISALLVSEHNETPGIGSRVCNRSRTESLWDKLRGKKDPEEQEGLQPNVFLDSFSERAMPQNGFAFNSENAERNIVPVSGATFSSTAVLHAVNKICSAWTEFHK